MTLRLSEVHCNLLLAVFTEGTHRGNTREVMFSARTEGTRALKKARPGLPAFWEVRRHTSGSAAVLLEASRALTLATLKY